MAVAASLREALLRLIGTAHVARRATATMIVDRDGFDPVNRVLQNEKLAQRHDDFVGQHRVRRRGADVEKKGTVRF